MDPPPRARRRPRRFEPRIINPVRMGTALLCSADAAIRGAGRAVETEMPWIRVVPVRDPAAVGEVRSPGPTVLICDDVALHLTDTDRLRRATPSLVVVLLSQHRVVQCAPPSVGLQACPYTAKADLVFAANPTDYPPERIIASAIRAAEDHLNIALHPDVRRFIFLIVDDEPRWFSQFLPVLYPVIGQRAAVKIVRTYEEALEFLFGVDREEAIPHAGPRDGYADAVVCLITDIFFPKGDRLDADAGKDLIALVRRHQPRIPIVIASKAPEAADLGSAGFVLPKGDPGSLELLGRYIRDQTGIGDLVISEPSGRELRRIRDVRGLCETLIAAEGRSAESERLRDILGTYGERDKFSTWLYMHSFRELGDRLRPRRATGEIMVAVLKREVRREMIRMMRTPLVVGAREVFTLHELVAALQDLPTDVIQPLSDYDVLSSWLDRKGYSELAEELRPVHGAGPNLGREIAGIVKGWMDVYRSRDADSPDTPDVA